MEIQNFGANLRFTPQSRFAPRTEEELLDVLAQCRGRRIRAVGRLHSWSAAPQSDDVLLDLRHLNAVRVEQRGDATWAHIQAGCQIKRAVAELERQANVTLPSLGLITEQTIAGAMSTGTHGSGRHSLSHYADEITVATYGNEGQPVLTTITDGDALLAARCSLGCTGIITSVAIRCRPQYRVEEHFRICDQLEEVLASEQQFPIQQFYLLPFQWRYLVQHRREASRGRSLLAPLYRLYWLIGIDLGLHLVLITLTRVLRSSTLLSFFYRYVLPVTLIRGWKVVDKSQHILTMEHELFRHIEIEIFVRQSRLTAALQFIRELLLYCGGDERAIQTTTWNELQQHGLDDAVAALHGNYVHHYPICIRKVLPDETLISMASGGNEPFYAISFINYNRPRERSGFQRFAEVLAQVTGRFFAARPHWGKVCPLSAAEADERYPRLAEFRNVCELLDPNGAFRNDWVQKALFDDRG